MSGYGVAFETWWKCGRKRRYWHEGDARSKAHLQKMFAYKCPACGAFHLSSKPGRDTLKGVRK